MNYVRPCPRCRTARPLTELVCQGRFQDQPCNWSLFDVLPAPASTEPTALPPEAVVPAAETQVPVVAAAQCRNGHPLGAGDFLCLVCGESAAPAIPGPGLSGDDLGDPAQPTSCVVKGWRLGAPLAVVSGESDLFLATRDEPTSKATGETAVFKHYRRGIEPEASLYPVLRALDPDHGLRLLDAGRFQERAFEVWEYLPLGTLGGLAPGEKANPEFVRQVVREIGSALHALSQAQIIHRDLKPANVLVRSQQPLDLVLADFSTAAVSEFDLQLTMSRQTTRYAAPETIVGTCSAASDWWSLGVMVLEMLTEGRGFEGVHERAFLLHLVTRGLRVPEDLPEEWRELLMGLLTRDPGRRWAWPQVQRWLGGERGIAHGYGDEDTSTAGVGNSLSLGGRAWSTPESWALAAAESGNWEAARDILLHGRLATWLQERGGERDAARVVQVRSLAADSALPEDARLSAALLVLNDNLPLCLRGEIITPAWVLNHPDIALAWLRSSLPTYLRRLRREPWFERLRERADRVHARIRESVIQCDEAQLSAALLATSQSMLEMRWRERRRLFPEAEHPALGAALERRAPSEEDLIILVSATLDAFRPAAEVLADAEQEAVRAGIPFPAAEVMSWLDLSRREILDALNDRVAHFVRCGRETADQWADDFRQNRRTTLVRALVLLSVPVADWREPPQQDYVRNVLGFFHKRLVNGMQRGGLVRMTIGRTTARLDLMELGGPARSAESLLASILTQETQLIALDPQPLLNDPQREQRLRRLHQNATGYRRDTGINALYMGFPFVVVRDSRTSEDAKPRIAPVLLWPIGMEVPAGTRGTVRLAFDEERSEVRINPALEGMLGAAAPAWREALDELRGREHLSLQSVLDVLGPLAAIAGQPASGPSRLSALPPQTVRVNAGEVQLHASAVLFLCDFSGQTIAEDLKQLAMRPIGGTALEAAIRAGMIQPADAPTDSPPEVDRYFTAAADPSQQAAVFQARQQPGLVVQGPPGTGKSQTIVNIVCDAIGRGERVIIVCQKLAALEVVRKRLETEGLTDRFFILNDPVSDRRPTLQALRQQLEQPIRSAAEDDVLQRERGGCARQIEALERELNSAHAALRESPTNRPGHLAYRALLDALITVERGPSLPVSYAPLGAALHSLDYAATEQLIAEIAPLTPLWREAKYEGSPLHCLAHFRTDEGTLTDLRQACDRLWTAERRRGSLLSQHERFFDFETPIPLQTWLSQHEAPLRALPAGVTELVSRWAAVLFPAETDKPSPAEQLVPWLNQTEARLRMLNDRTIAPPLYGKLASEETGALPQLVKDSGRLARPPGSFFTRLSPSRWFARLRISSWLRSAGADPKATDLGSLQAVAELELAMREVRPDLAAWRLAFGGVVPGSPEPLPVLKSSVSSLLEQLRPVIEAARRVQACPVQPAAHELRQAGNPTTCAAVLDMCRASIELWSATRESEARLDEAAPWFTPEWVATSRLAIRARKLGSDSLDQVAAAFSTLPSFQTFRLRARALDPLALRIFALLRDRDGNWQGFAAADLPAEITRTLRREALLAWKDAAEQSCPALLMTREEHQGKVQLLGRKDFAMRESNRRLLSGCSARTPIARRPAWDDVVMLTGARARRLREVVERGNPLGLFHLRPIWMMNPEMAGRLLPLQPGLFDLLIFDEASQLPVECALPALFRARRVVVSGDEKQMPPSRFFGSQLDSDEEATGEEWLDADDGGLGEDERERLRQAANRRELKDCPDLLTLAQNLLPTATLEIHYRSKYRELINFSNAAFYAGRLSIPARHPERVVREACPLEVDRVNGCYADQTNESEATRVVERLRDLWRRPAPERPSVGVVTFNLKQADLIQDKLEALAELDDNFRQAWEIEQERTQRGEDMGFFVKNLENVQGDERDWIIFSTTFGRDERGTFRRNFGVLGQHGGERRLNVAITRAREKVLLVTSLPLSEISSWATNHGRRPPSTPRDFLQGWLTYAERLHARQFPASADLLRALEGTGRPTARSRGENRASISALGEDVATFLRQLGYDPVPAHGDAFGVDFAIVDPRTGLFGLGVECDAPNHAVLDTARARELWRPSVLAASIPVLHRVGLRAWYHDRAAEQQRLREAVQSVLGPKQDHRATIVL